MATYCVSCGENTANKNSSPEELNRIDQWLYQIVLFVLRKTQGSLKIKKQVDYLQNKGS